jgi:DNA-binding CsgD family transcriptional regulator
VLARITEWSRLNIVAMDTGAGEAALSIQIDCGGDRLVARFLGRVGKGRFLCALDHAEASGEFPASVAARFRLTPREAEVLSWLASGKTDRDIAEILGMRPRTVNKHLEHIYVKLGVETRTAAASVAQGVRA